MKQADYDLATAVDMFKAGRYIYCVFMCHLAVEKILKSIYVRKNNQNPPKTHDLSYLCETIQISLPENLNNFIDDLNELSVPTRYPDYLAKILKEYRKKETETILLLSKKFILWAKKY